MVNDTFKMIKSRYVDENNVLKRINAISVEINSEEYKKAEAAAHQMWARKKRGDWGRGYINTPDDPERVERTGRLGEIAFCKVFNTIPDFSYIEGGDITDTILNGKKIDVKTQLEKYGILIKCENNGVKTPLKSDIYVQCFVEMDDRLKKVAKIHILGYYYREEIEKFPKRPKENWVNYVGNYKNMHPITDLLQC